MNTIIENPNIVLIVETIIYILSAYILFYIGKLAYKTGHKKINVKEELVRKDNVAFSLSVAGYYIGLLLAIGSAIIGPSQGLLIDIFDIGVYGLLAIILLNLSTIINDKIILRKFSITKEIIEDQNAGTGIIESANFIASGLIIHGAVSGEGINLFENLAYGYLLSGIVTAVVFWLTGQLLLLVTSFVYDLITPYNIHDHIEKDNIAVGIGFAGAIIAIANIIRFGISGDFESWMDHFYKVLIDVLIGFAFLPILRFITDKVLLPGEKLTDEIINQEHPNIGASIIEAFAYIGGSVLLTWCL